MDRFIINRGKLAHITAPWTSRLNFVGHVDGSQVGEVCGNRR